MTTSTEPMGIHIHGGELRHFGTFRWPLDHADPRIRDAGEIFRQCRREVETLDLFARKLTSDRALSDFGRRQRVEEAGATHAATIAKGKARLAAASATIDRDRRFLTEVKQLARDDLAGIWRDMELRQWFRSVGDKERQNFIKALWTGDETLRPLADAIVRDAGAMHLVLPELLVKLRAEGLPQANQEKLALLDEVEAAVTVATRAARVAGELVDQLAHRGQLDERDADDKAEQELHEEQHRIAVAEADTERRAQFEREQMPHRGQ